MSEAVLRRIEPADDCFRQSLSDIGLRSGQLGVEIADMAGIVGDLTALGQQQTAQARAAVAAARTRERPRATPQRPPRAARTRSSR